MSSRGIPTEMILKPKTRRGNGGTFSALRHPAFRIYFGGQLVSVSGTWMQTVAQQIVVYNLTKSELALGLVACAQGLPALFLSPFAGVLVERWPRRSVLVGTQITMMILAFIMAVLYGTNALQIWHVVLLSLALGVANAVDAPARLSFLVEMVGHDDLPSGIVVNSLMFNVSRIIGPALGGIALAGLGATACFVLNGLSFLAVIAGLLLMHVSRAELPISTTVGLLRPLREGLGFARHHETIGPLLLLSALTSTFGLTFSVLFAPFADHVLHNTETGTSALLTAHGVGALIASALVAVTTNRGYRGKMLAAGAILAPLAVIVLAFMTGFVAALIASAVAGFAFICQFVLSNTLLQTNVPDEFRGRVMSLYSLTFFGLTPFGNLVIGLTAEEIGVVTAILIFGGINLVCSAFILLRAPQIRRLK